MKTTCHTAGLFAADIYRAGIPAFLEQYREKFPGLSYLHLSLEEADQANLSEEDIHYYGEGRFLKIRVAKWTEKSPPNPFEVYGALRDIFDLAVMAHLETHQWV